MALDIFKDTKDIDKVTGAKILVFGEAGAGKSTFVTTFPRSFLIDSENGHAFYLQNSPNVLKVANTQSFKEIEEALDELCDEQYMKDFDTFIIDSYSKVYDNMMGSAYDIVEKRALREKMKGKDVDLDDINLTPRDWGTLKRWGNDINNLITKMSSMGKIVVVTAREKPIEKTVKKGSNWVQEIVGYAPELKKQESYDWDVVMRLVREKNPETGEEEIYGKFIKDRTLGLQGKKIKNPTFEIWKELFEKKTTKNGEVIDYTDDIDKSTEKLKNEETEVVDMLNDIKESMNELDGDKKKEVFNFISEKLKQLNIKKLNEEVPKKVLEEILEEIKK